MVIDNDRMKRSRYDNFTSIFSHRGLLPGGGKVDGSTCLIERLSIQRDGVRSAGDVSLGECGSPTSA